MNETLNAKDEAKFRFNEEPECRELLNNLPLDELMVAAILLPKRYPKSIPSNKKALIQTCIEELASIKFSSKVSALRRLMERIKKHAATADEARWIKDPMPKRLEEFLRNQTNVDWVDVDGISNTKHFLIMHNIEVIHWYDRNSELSEEPKSLFILKKEWSHIENLNELKGLKKENSKDFLEHFSQEYKRIALENGGRYVVQKVESIHLETIEDAVIWLDLFSDNPLERSAITNKILKSWQQKQYRKTSGKIQKNFNLSEAIISTLKKLADKHDLNETEIISILIKEELRNDLYIKKALARVDALQQVIESEQGI